MMYATFTRPLELIGLVKIFILSYSKMKVTNVTGQKVLIPAILFALLNSGFVWFARKNSHKFGQGLLVNAILFVLINYLLMKIVLQKNLTQADIIVPALLFILLTPGVILTLPPGPGGILTSGETSGAATAVHTLVFAVVFAFLRGQFSEYY